MREYYTKTGVILTVIQGGGEGDGIPQGLLRSVDLPDELQGETISERVAAVKAKRPKVLTKGELNKMSRRIDEINTALELCGDHDTDVKENLENELEGIIRVLDDSAKKAK